MNQGTASKASTTGFVIKLTVVAALGGFLFGYDTAVISGVVPFITTKFSLSDTMVGYAVGSAIVGCIIGSFAAGPISDSLGRKKVLIFTAVLFAISSIGAGLAGTRNRCLCCSGLLAVLVLARHQCYRHYIYQKLHLLK